MLLNLDSLNQQTLDCDPLYFSNKIMNDHILFHGSRDWYIYSMNNNELSKAEFPNIYVYPKYYLVNDDTIFVESDNFTFYTGKIKLEK